MLLKHFFVPKIAHSSYMLVGAEIGVVVDPQRDIGAYLDAARELGVRITHVLHTHLHADFVSGHLDLAEQTGATIWLPRKAGCAFRHQGVTEGDVLTLEDMAIEVIETPGHTPEHVSYLFRDRARGESPVGVFCGDTLFVGDVGRPDLFPGRAEELAGSLHVSLGKLVALPDFCEVYPAHGAGSLCGRSMAAKLQSTIGYEKRHNPSLIADREQFIRSVTTNMPAVPDHFARCSEINRQGPTLTSMLLSPRALDPNRFADILNGGTAVVLDVRDYDAFGGQHVPQAFNIALEGNFPVFAGWVLPADHDVLIVADDDTSVEDAVRWLQKVGIDRVTGYLDGGMFAWASEGLPTAHIPQLSTLELHERVVEEGPRIILDVRSSSEYAASQIRGAVNIPAPQLRTRFAELSKDVPIVTICGTGQRSSLAASILKQQGFTHVCNAAGGMRGYAAAAFAPRCVLCSIPHGPQLIVRSEE